MEAVSPAYRGILGVLPPLLTQVGLLVTYVGGMWLDWSRLAVALLGLLVPSVLLFWAIPESPCFLAANGRQAAMETALERLGRSDEKTDPKFLQLLSSAATADKMADSLWTCNSLKIYRQRSIWQPVLTSLAIMFFSHATGFSLILGNSKLIFIDARLGFIHEDKAMATAAVIILVSCGIAIGLSKIAPRRALLLFSAIACCLILTFLGLYYYIKRESVGSDPSFAWVPLAALLSLIVCHMCGYGAVAWTIIVEMLPGTVRGQVFPLAVAYSCVSSFGFGLSYRTMKSMVGFHVVIWMYAAITALGALVVFFWVPETKDRTEAEIAEFFASSEDSEDSCSLEVVITTSSCEDLSEKYYTSVDIKKSVRQRKMDDNKIDEEPILEIVGQSKDDKKIRRRNISGIIPSYHRYTSHQEKPRNIKAKNTLQRTISHAIAERTVSSNVRHRYSRIGENESDENISDHSDRRLLFQRTISC
jgi:hypothetical protein